MKDTEKALIEELCKHFIGEVRRLKMMSKLVLSVLKMCTVNFAINILTISIYWRGIAIPLVWMLLDKRGNSNQEERILRLE